jgi:60 kDa SS-A/Ro ribonucleoprotein
MPAGLAFTDQERNTIMTRDALTQIRTRGQATPQSVQAHPAQVRNNAGGWAFQASDETRVHRFLTIGTTGGTFYTDERKATRDNGELVIEFARANASRLVQMATEVSVAGRAPRNQQAILALMAAMALGDTEGRRAAALAFNDVVRTGTHLFTAARYAEQFRGWGRIMRRAFAHWYLDKDAERLAYQLVKYRQRDGWAHLDVVRSASYFMARHPQLVDQAHRDLFNWLAKGVTERDELPKWIVAYERAREIERSSERGGAKTAAYVRLIEEYPGLPWEALPDEATSQADVNRALIEAGMPVTALIRNLPKLTRLGVIAPMSTHLRLVTERLTDAELLRKGRVHPLALMVAAKVYASGRSEKGDSRWTPVPQVSDALSGGFYLAFPAVEPSGKRVMEALDVSGSMTSSAAGYCLSAREVVAGMALVTMNTEPAWGVYGFSTEFMPLQLSPGMRLDAAMRYMSRLPFGGTDASLPMQWAAQTRTEVDVFRISTDYETWAGRMHPHEALEAYRQKMGINARMQMVAVAPNEYSFWQQRNPVPGSIATDLGVLDVSGFDTDVPVLLANHARGDI